MSILYNAGENKKRPGVYRRQSNIGTAPLVGGQDGICAIPIQATWGPLGQVVAHKSANSLTETYGIGTYGATYTVPAAEAMFKGGASTVYTYRLGTGGKKATATMEGVATFTAKYVGTYELSVSIKEKLGAEGVFELVVFAGKTQVEKYEFSAANFADDIAKINSKSKYIEITAKDDALSVGDYALTGGENPTVANTGYSTAFAAFESYYYNTIALDKDDDASMTLSLLLQSYLAGASKLGKLGMAVVGEKSTVDFDTRCAHAKAFNDEKAVYLGGGYKTGAEDKDGVLAICYTAGVIASTPSNQGITHTIITEATEICESLTYAQYEQAIDSGMLMLSTSADGSVWFDTGINTLVKPDAETQDDGWKKIRRVKVRFEMIDRLDRVLAPKVGKVSADSDGIADIIQAGQRVLDAMANNEGKLHPGATFIEDPANPFNGDSGWFIVQADDIDSLEKIYLHYQFRYSQNV